MTQGFRPEYPTLLTGRAHLHPEPLSGHTYSAVELMPGDACVIVLDQRRLPAHETYLRCVRYEEVVDALVTSAASGGGTTAIAAAYGMVLAAIGAPGEPEAYRKIIEAAGVALRTGGAANLRVARAVDLMERAAFACETEPPADRVRRLAEHARALHRAEVAACRRIGALGAAWIPDGATVLTFGNTGALGTGGYGCAAGALRAARDAGKRVRVFLAETRPRFEGLRLLAWELAKDGFSVEMLTDSMVAHYMHEKAVDVVIAGADRIAANGDIVSDVGAYALACLAETHRLPFYVAAPSITIDFECRSRKVVVIEERDAREVTHIPTPNGDISFAPDAVRARNPAFDAVPARLVRAIVTERGVVEPVDEARLREVASRTFAGDTGPR